MSRREERIEIPRANRDLRAYVTKKRVGVWLKTLLWEGICLIVFVYYGGREDMNFDYRFQLVLSVLLLAGLFLFGWVKLMLDRNYRGKITAIKLGQAAKSNPNSASGRWVSIQQMVLTVEEENGRRHKIAFPFKRSYDRYYHIGDRVTHYSGLPYPESNDGADRDLYVCSRCGGVEKTDTDHCHGCGMTLIKPYRSRYTQDGSRIR